MHLIKPSLIKFRDRLAHQQIIAGLEWNKESITWFVNGKKIKTIKNKRWHEAETINFDSEAFPDWWGLPDENDNGGEFQIEYFRYWKKNLQN